MLERGHSIADYQIVKPLVANQVFQTSLVEAAEYGFARLHRFNSELFLDEKSRQNFLKASDSLLGQSFPGACTLLQADVGDEAIYVLYPVPQGQPLRERLDSVFTVRQALEMVRQIAECLSLAHGCGLWHGNLSTETIYLDADRPILVDFALSSLVRLDFNSGVDPCYSSPELVRGETLGPQSDLYSLGILLYRLLTGELPFTGDEPFAIAMQHLQGDIPQLPEYLQLCQSVLESLVFSVAQERTTADELIQNLDRLLTMPGLDELQAPIQLQFEEMLPALPSEATKPADKADEEAEAVTPETASSIEQVMAESDVATRIEERLKERAAALQSSAQGTGSERADTARMTAIAKPDRQVSNIMDQNRYQPKTSRVKFLLLPLVGIALGAVLYLFIFQAAPKQSQQVVGALPEELAAGLEDGRQLLQRDDLDGAEKAFVDMVDKYPSFPQPYNNLAAVYASQGHLEDARTALEQALATDEGYATVYRNLGTVYAEMARDSYGRALQLKNGPQSVSLQLFAADGPLPLQLSGSVTTAAKATTTGPVAAVIATAETKPEVATRSQDLSAVKPVAVARPEATDVPPAIAEEVAEVVLAPEPESAELFLYRWSEAWSAQNVESYLSFYADSFVPSSGQSRSGWEENRQTRLTQPKQIEVTLEDFSIVRMRGDKLQMEVTQGYRSERYADRTRKLFDLQRKGDRWEILRERSLGRVR